MSPALHRETMLLSIALPLLTSLAVQATPTIPAPIPAIYSTWATDSTTKVMPTDLPPSSNIPSSIDLKLARCETGSFQIAVRSSTTLKSVSLTPAPLLNTTLAIPLTNISWFEIGVLQAASSNGKTTVLLPELLLPATSFTLPANTTVSILISVTVPCDAHPTSYMNAFYVKTPIGSRGIKVQTDVYPFAIPAANQPGALSHFSQSWTLADFGTAAQYQQYGDMMLSYRMSPDNIWRNATPNPDTLGHWYGLGLDRFNLHKADSAYLPHIDAFFTKLAAEPHGKQLRAAAYFSGYDEKSVDYLNTVVRSGSTYTSASNSPDIVGAAANLRMLRSHYPDVPVFSTAYIRTRPWLDPVDDLSKYWISSVLAEHSQYVYTEGELVRNSPDAELSVSPQRNHGYRTYFGLNAEPATSNLTTRSGYWAMYQQKADGYTANMTNAWTRFASTIPSIDPKTGPIFSYVWADPSRSVDEMIFHGVAGPIASMRMVAARDGMQDYEYLYALAVKSGSVEVAREIAETVSVDWKLPTTVAPIQAARATIAKYLAQPNMASRPSPEHRSMAVIASQAYFLSWSAGLGATKYDIYIGDSLVAVQSATGKSPEYRGRIVMNKLQVSLSSSRTYYWRVDVLSATGPISPGYTWKFTTAPTASPN